MRAIGLTDEYTMIKPNPSVAAMEPYAVPDISAPEGVEAIVLAQNEHAYPPSEKVRAAVNESLVHGRLYPDGEWKELRAAISRVHKLNPDHILCGCGSMELMSALVLAYLSPQDRILLSQYGYLFMRTLARLVGASTDMAAEVNYHVDIDNFLTELKPNTKLVFVVNPGNPCGSVIHNDEIRRLRAGLPDDVLLLIDEAYAEFVDTDFHSPLFDLIDLDNTIVTRTFSKIYGLAGMRVGWGYFPPAILVQLRKVINPSNISVLSQVAACAAMKDQETAQQAKLKTTQQRYLLSAGISKLGLTVVPSQTNFVLVDFSTSQQADSAFEFMRARGIIVRPMGGYGLSSCLRITVGLEPHMQQTIDHLAAWQD